MLSTDALGIPELISPDRGRLVEPGDPEALAAGIEELLALGEGERVALGRAGAQWVRAHCDVRRETARLAGWIAAAGHTGPRAPGR